MDKIQSFNDFLSYFLNHKILLKWYFLVILSCMLFNGVLSQSLVETLPGYDGPLPFKLETGYVGVGESEEVQLFYYFIESENEPKNDPLMLWLTGGPGCSALSGLAYEIGPFTYDLDAYDGGFPSLLQNPYSWTKVANIIFLDSPVGTGFSYSNTSGGYHSSDTKAVEDIYTFLQKWLLKHPNYIRNRLYISGDSYAGKWIPMLTWKISQGNEAGVEPHMHLQGYTLGNPVTDYNIDGNAKLPFAHRLALISDKYFQMAKTGCNGNYIKPDTSNALCALALQHYTKCISNIYTANVLEPACKKISQIPKLISRRNVLKNNFWKILLPSNQKKHWCRNNNYNSIYIWANDPSVQEALQIRKGTIKEWQRCNKDGISYDKTIESVIQYHHQLSTKNYKALVYSGDHDFIVPYIGTLEWINKLNLTLDDDWHDWTVDDEVVAGYTQRFRQEQSQYYLTFATVKGAGHTAPEYKPKECLAMIKRFLSNNSL